MPRVPYPELYAVLERAMLGLGLRGERAILCARLFAETTRDGVYTHGLNRFSRFSAMVHNGSIDINATPERVSGTNVLERWDGHLGPGNLAAHAAMSRAVNLAKQSGLGAVALARTSHWMRGGTYGWLAAEAGVVGICFTNTMPNMPPWGATSPALGNNPIILAIPRSNGAHVVLDMAMSQFSYGTLAAYSKREASLPFDGGFDFEGNLTRDASAIERSLRPLPIGYWKGSGLAVAVDLMAAMLSAGLATHEISADPLRESGVSQFFLAIDPTMIGSTAASLDATAHAIIESVHRATSIDSASPARYPGEETFKIRAENLHFGVPVDLDVWQQINREYPAA